jgi:2-C-methyl-D-erythritol 4-phosphate cytidylyltransferase
MVTSSATANHPSPAESGRVAGIIVAGGSSTRMSTDKLWLELGGEPLIARSIRAFAACDRCDDLVVVVASGVVSRVRRLLENLGIAAQVAIGGAQRQDSVRAGLAAVADADAEWVVIHDAARPLVTGDLITRGLTAARETGAAIAAMPVVDTIKVVEAGRIVATPPRATLWQAQTPQVFRRTVLVNAHAAATDSTATDDSALVEAQGVDVHVYEGSYQNIKITTDVDLVVARALLAVENAPGSGRPVSSATSA